ncbi:DUF6455 family protein [Chelativorans intermedius]|uniref:DUF6455 family protein n=1 Tax=Chelativorans intermedius TaxID=515947 RepID=A0ABV6D665_9HYPH
MRIWDFPNAPTAAPYEAVRAKGPGEGIVKTPSPTSAPTHGRQPCGPFEQRWSQTHKVWRQFAQFDLMMKRTGVDPVAAARTSGGVEMAQARNVCLQCLEHRECRDWLANTQDLQPPPDFCPNALFFRRFRQEPG